MRRRKNQTVWSIFPVQHEFVETVCPVVHFVGAPLAADKLHGPCGMIENTLQNYPTIHAAALFLGDWVVNLRHPSPRIDRIHKCIALIQGGAIQINAEAGRLRCCLWSKSMGPTYTDATVRCKDICKAGCRHRCYSWLLMHRSIDVLLQTARSSTRTGLLRTRVCDAGWCVVCRHGTLFCRPRRGRCVEQMR